MQQWSEKDHMQWALPPLSGARVYNLCFGRRHHSIGRLSEWSMELDLKLQTPREFATRYLMCFARASSNLAAASSFLAFCTLCRGAQPEVPSPFLLPRLSRSPLQSFRRSLGIRTVLQGRVPCRAVRGLAQRVELTVEVRGRSRGSVSLHSEGGSSMQLGRNFTTVGP